LIDPLGRTSRCCRRRSALCPPARSGRRQRDSPALLARPRSTGMMRCAGAQTGAEVSLEDGVPLHQRVVGVDVIGDECVVSEAESIGANHHVI